MAAASNLIVLLDILDAGLTLNARMADYFRQKEMAGEEVTAEDLKALAEESDKAYLDFKSLS